MATMILAADRPTAGVVPKPIIDILGDPTLSMGEKLLLLEGLFVHDSTPGSGTEDGRPWRAVG
jgi:hypothetical protein